MSNFKEERWDQWGTNLVVIVTGGRSFGAPHTHTPAWEENITCQEADVFARARVERIHLNRVLSELKPSMVVQGGASGADECAALWAARNSIPWLTWPADWGKHGRAAGPIRNRQMLTHIHNYCQASERVLGPQAVRCLLVAFPGGKGTASCVKTAQDLGIQVRDERGE